MSKKNNSTNEANMSKKKKSKSCLVIISMLLLGLNANAEQIILSNKYPIVNAYIAQYKGKRSIEDTKAFLDDKYFIEANTYIYDEDKKKTITLKVGDVEVLKSLKTVETKSPDYKSALATLSICVNKTSNPLAAWEGLHLIKAYFGIDYKKNINDYKKFSKILYEEKSCDGFLSYGDIYKDGIGIKVDEKQALKIYTEGVTVCKKDWQNVALEMRINRLKSKVKVKK